IVVKRLTLAEMLFAVDRGCDKNSTLLD
ncbi:hypothetical protein Tco_1487496, partial [Tanacetum coccineum]